MSLGQNIAIIGAGPSGLTLAALLARKKIQFTIFELEDGNSHRDQGGTLDLHPGSGLLALEEAGILEEFGKHARPEGDALKILSPSGRTLWDENKLIQKTEQADERRPEIDRALLRQILLDAVGSENVQWNKKLQSIENAGDVYDLHFANSVERGFDLVIGADGAWSKVRSAVTQVMPYYSGVSLVDLWALEAEQRHPWLHEFVGAGSCFMFDRGRAVIAQKNGSGSVRTYACVQQSEFWVKDCGIDWSQESTALDLVVETYFGDCGDNIKRMMLEANDKLITRPLYMLPVGLTWEPCPGVTLIGDAAHLMTPFAGSGVNTAMHDAYELAIAIEDAIKEDSGLIGAVARYEKSMFVRAKEATQQTLKQMQDSFKEGGSQIMLNFMKSARPDIADEASGQNEE